MTKFLHRLSFLFVCLFSCLSYGWAQDQTVTLTTDLNVGDTLRLEINPGAQVSVDWGDGTFVDCQTTQIKEKIKGQDITIKGSRYWEFLDCSGNKITALVLTNAPSLQTVFCNDNQLVTLGLYRAVNLVDLDCSNNQLESLSISTCTQLKRLNCAHNNIGNLSLNNNTELTWLNCSYNNLLSLNLTYNTKLDMVWCQNNTLKNYLTLKNSSKISSIVCSNNELRGISINTTEGVPELIELFASNNAITQLDLTTAEKMSDLVCNDNKITFIDIPERLIYNIFNCANNNLAFNSLPNYRRFPIHFTYTPQNTYELPVDHLDVSVPGDDTNTYKLDLSDIQRDAVGARVGDIIWYNKSDQALTEDEVNEDNFVSAFYKDMDGVYGVMTSSKYPGLSIQTTTLTIGSPSAIHNIKTDKNTLQIKVLNGTVQLEANETTPVKIFSAAGVKVWQGVVSSTPVLIPLSKGLYLINSTKVCL